MDPPALFCAREDPHRVGYGLRAEENISELCRREGIDGWSKEFLEAVEMAEIIQLV